MTQKFAKIITIAVILILFAAVSFWIRHRITHVDENDARIESELITIASRVDGWLLSRDVIEGDAVAKNHILGELDKRDAVKRLAVLENSVAARKAQLAQVKLQRDTAEYSIEAQIETAKAVLSAAEAAAKVMESQLEIARNDFSRANSLLKPGAISYQSWDHSRSTMQQNESSLRESNAKINTQKSNLTQILTQRGQVRVLEQQMEVLRKEIASLESQAAQVNQEIADRTLHSPIDGIVDKTFIHSGDYVQAGQWLLMLHDPHNVWVEANVKETEIGRLRVGQNVKVSVDAYPGLKLTGHVFRIGNAATSQFALLPSPNPSGNFTKITQRVPVRISIDNIPRPLQPGLMAEVSIDVSD